MHSRRLVVAFAAAAFALPAAAQPNFPDAVLHNRVALGCAIEAEKVFVVTNTTAGPIVAGTPIFIDILHFPTGQHDVLNYHGGDLPPGGVFREGTYQATSCTAWIEVPLTLAPSVLVPTTPVGPAAPVGDRPLQRAP
jgi:hypothetical protein